MTRTTNARLAGFTFLFYIATAFSSMVLFDRAASGDASGVELARIARHETEVRITILLSLITCFAALVLAVTLYRITRDEDRDLALLAAACRVGEGLMASTYILATTGLLWLATAAGSSAPDVLSAQALGALLFRMQNWNTLISAIFFAVGSTLFAWLFLRGRMIPLWLAWVGVIASVLLVLVLPLQLAGFVRHPLLGFVWFPMLVFEVVLGVWLLFNGVGAPLPRPRLQAIS